MCFETAQVATGGVYDVHVVALCSRDSFLSSPEFSLRKPKVYCLTAAVQNGDDVEDRLLYIYIERIRFGVARL